MPHLRFRAVSVDTLQQISTPLLADLCALTGGKPEFVTLDELPDLEKGFAEVMKAWQDGDQATLINLLKEEMAPPKLQAWLEQTLLAERNRNWVKQWPGLPNESFIVVGALHLYGEQGLLALLEQQGWRITPLTEPAAAN